MIALPSGQNVRVWIATGYTDMRCGFRGRPDEPALVQFLGKQATALAIAPNHFYQRSASGHYDPRVIRRCQKRYLTPDAILLVPGKKDWREGVHIDTVGFLQKR